MDYSNLSAFYAGKRILVTGNTGFKGSWLTHILLGMGAEVAGYALKPDENSLYHLAGLDTSSTTETCGHLTQFYSDIRSLDRLQQLFNDFRPEIVLHLAAQPIVRTSYADPVYTYETNVMGTVNVCECIRRTDSVRSFVNVTTDKVYHNYEWERGYVETDFLDGIDPYSNSKSCSELVTHSYAASFLADRGISVSTARAGNVIGGGDFSPNRIIPDCVRAAMTDGRIIVRNPYSTRPYQHVLEPLYAYLMIARAQYDNSALASGYNVGPDDIDCVTTGDLVDIFCNTWNRGLNRSTSASADPQHTASSTEPAPAEKANPVTREDHPDPNAPREAGFLKLDCTKLKTTFDWSPRWHIDRAVAETIAWTRVWLDGGDIPVEMDREIAAYTADLAPEA